MRRDGYFEKRLLMCPDEAPEPASDSRARSRFFAEAIQSKARFDRDGLAYRADEVFAYVRARLQGRNPRPPRLYQWPT